MKKLFTSLKFEMAVDLALNMDSRPMLVAQLVRALTYTCFLDLYQSNESIYTVSNTW